MKYQYIVCTCESTSTIYKINKSEVDILKLYVLQVLLTQLGCNQCLDQSKYEFNRRKDIQIQLFIEHNTQ